MLTGIAKPVFGISEVALPAVYDPMPETPRWSADGLAYTVGGIEEIMQQEHPGEAPAGHLFVDYIKFVKSGSNR